MTCRHNKNSLALQEWNGRKQVQEGDFYVYPVSSCCLKKDTKLLDAAGSLSGNWEGFHGFQTHIYKYMVFFSNFRGAFTFIYTRKKVPHHKRRRKQNKELIKKEHNDVFMLRRMASCRMKCSHQKVGCTSCIDAMQRLCRHVKIH